MRFAYCGLEGGATRASSEGGAALSSGRASATMAAPQITLKLATSTKGLFGIFIHISGEFLSTKARRSADRR